MEKAIRQSSNSIKSLRKENTTYTDDVNIFKIARDFYSELYTSQEPCMDDIENYLQNAQLPTHSEDQQVLCEGLITLPECELTLQKMKPNKSPGEDGLPIEFYKAFWGDVGKFLIEMYNECLEKK